MGSRNLWLEPPPGGKKTSQELLGANKTVSTSLSPRAQSLAVYTTSATIHDRQSPTLKKETHPIWFAQWDTVEPYRREFVTQSFLVYVKYRENVRRIMYKEPQDFLSNKSIALYAETCQSYIDIIQRLLQKNKEAKPELRMNESEQALFEALFPALDLFQVVYMPSHGYINALIARELLAWLNSNFAIRSDELGILLSIETPWKALNFWNFIKHCALRCVLEPVSLLLGIVSEKHPSVATREVTSLILRAIMTLPNLENFQHDQDFYDAHRLWKTGLHKLRRECAKHKDARYEGKTDLEEMLCLLEGNTKTLYEICERTGGGFREAVCVWGIWINEGLSREHLPDVTAAVLADIPMDSTSIEDVLHAALLKKEAAKVASTANDMDLWLAAHITDLMLPLHLPEGSVILSLRHHFILGYAESILSDPGLWRMAVEYMVTCEHTGLQTAREVLLRVPLRILESAPKAITSGDNAASSRTHLEDLLEVCDEHNFLDTKAYICRTASRMFATRKEYGRAIDYCARALDITALTRVVNLLLDDYLEQGPKAFITLVDGISAHLLYPDLPGAPPAPFGETLRFMVRYAEFHHTLLEGRRADAAGELTDLFGSDLVPRSWWGLLLVDAAELLSSEDDMILTINEVHTLLARLEEICANESFGQGSAGEYLVALRRRTKLESDAEALERLESVRLNFVRYASKCMMSGIGGEGSLLDTPVVICP